MATQTQRASSNTKTLSFQASRLAPVSKSSAAVTSLEMAQAITTTVREAVNEFNLIGRDVAEILGVSPSFMSKLRRGHSILGPDSHAYHNGVLLVRTLDALGGLLGPASQVRSYLYSSHDKLGGRPIEIMRRPVGLVDVTRYVESFVS